MKQNSNSTVHRSLFTLHCSPFTVHRSLFIILCSFYIVIILAMTSCTKSTSPQTGSLSGRVVLVNDTGDPSLDPVDYSGVTVALYELAELDTTIVRINQEYPNIGVQISQETEFDHRFQDPVRAVQTSGDGTFSIDKVNIGMYNLVIFKDGWSIKYLYDIDLAEGENTIIPIYESFELFPLRTMPTVLHEDYVFQTNKTYFFGTDTTILGNVQIEGSALILIGSGKRLDFHGQVVKQQDSSISRITSASQMYSTNLQTDVDPFLMINFSQISNVDVNGIILDHSNDGIIVVSNGASLENVIITHMTNSLTIQGNSTSIELLLMRYSFNRGIVVQGQLTLSKSILYNNRDACFSSETETDIHNNYIIQNYIGLRPFYGVNTIHNNCFDRNETAIAPCASDPFIHHNDFYNNSKDIELNGYYIQSSMAYCNPVVSNNNFFGSGWYIHLRGSNSVYANGAYQFDGVDNNQIYPDNYLVAHDLIPHVFDANNPNSIDFEYTASFIPRKLSMNTNSGII